MPPMQIKRGRPPKEKSETMAVTVTTPVSPKAGSVDKNRLYKFKDGRTCRVTYSNNKDKEEVINL